MRVVFRLQMQYWGLFTEWKPSWMVKRATAQGLLLRILNAARSIAYIDIYMRKKIADDMPLFMGEIPRRVLQRDGNSLTFLLGHIV